MRHMQDAITSVGCIYLVSAQEQSYGSERRRWAFNTCSLA